MKFEDFVLVVIVIVFAVLVGGIVFEVTLVSKTYFEGTVGVQYYKNSMDEGDDHLKFVFYKDGIIVSLSRHFVWLRDTNDDDVADLRKFRFIKGHNGFRIPGNGVVYGPAVNCNQTNFNGFLDCRKRAGQQNIGVGPLFDNIDARMPSAQALDGYFHRLFPFSYR